MRELIGVLARSGVPFVVIGGHGLAVHGVQRDTVDLDCLVAAERRDEISAHLLSLGFQEMGRHQNFCRFRHRSLVYPFLDVMQVDRGTWGKIEAGAITGVLFGHAIKVPSVPHYIALKLHAIAQSPEREDQDRNDIVQLVRVNRDAVTDAEIESLCERYAPAGFWAILQTRL
jgi:hypothetical protein